MSNEQQPLVSIIMPSYNRADMVGETLDSIIAQTYPNWECVIVDDGSTDNTREVIASYVKKDSRIQLHQRNRQPKGAAACRNIAIELSKGAYLVFFDTDDLFAPDCLERRVAATYEQKLDFYLYQGAKFSKEIGDIEGVIAVPQKNNGKIGISEYLEPFPQWCGTSSMWEKSAFEELLWDESLKVWQDVHIYIRAILKGYTFDFFDGEPDFFWRHHFADKNRISNRRFTTSYIASKLSAIHDILPICDPENEDILKRIMTKDMFSVMEQNAINEPPVKTEFKQNLAQYLALVRFPMQRKLHAAYLKTIHFMNRMKIPYIKGLLAKTFGKMLKSRL